MKKLIVATIMYCFSQLLAASPLPDKPHVYVEGSAEIEVVPDLMTFSLLIEKSDLDLALAKADVDSRSTLLISTCKKLGIKPDAIATTALSIFPEYDYKDQQRVFSGNRVSRQVDIKLKDLTKYAQVMKALVDAKITQTINTKLSLTDEKAAEDNVLISAMADAKARAERLAKSQGKALGEPFSISEFNTRAEEIYNLRVSRSIVGDSASDVAPQARLSKMEASEPFEPGVMKAKAQVYVVYLLK
ncbi:MAG: DUF541 domain-containing protein [Moraxellaceae bacterium]|nr:MAG: DUF541 domain-containing protein [Moraxellaceae bacterium]